MAKRICGLCDEDVRTQCLKENIGNNNNVVIAGLTKRERNWLTDRGLTSAEDLYSDVPITRRSRTA
jgi:hypothetical protein